MNKLNDRYVQICSEKTLQDSTEGFFLTWANNVADAVGDTWITKVFGKLKTDKDRFRIIFREDLIKELVVDVLNNVQEVYRKKDIKISVLKRQEAQQALQNGEQKKALMLYSQSILRASDAGEQARTLTLSLWDRSQLLFSLNEYSCALNDIQTCLKLKPPDNFKGDAYAGMAICYKNLGQDSKAKVAFALAEKLCRNEQKLQVLRREFDKVPIGTGTDKSKVLPHVTGKCHSTFHCASDKIAVDETKEMGRFVVAQEAINTGDTLVVEPAFAACLLPEKFGTHCHHCFKRLLAPVGCSDCSSVAFCSFVCRDLALSTYHRYECKFLDLLIGSGMSILSHTALRTITQNNLQECLEAYQNRTKESIYSLCTNSSKRQPRDFLQRTLMAAFLLQCLKKSGYFGQDRAITKEAIPNESEYQIGELILFHLQMLQFNAHEIYENVHSAEHRLKEVKLVNLGVAVYPTVALFNHDCYPGVTRYFVGKHIVISASRPLQPGELIGENYGPIFTARNLAERQRSLSARYWFNCLCSACKEDWPPLKGGLQSTAKRIKCSNSACNYLFSLPVKNKDIKCPSCHQMVSLLDNIKRLEWCEEQYNEARNYIDCGEAEQAIKILCPAIDWFHQVSAPPHKETHLAQDSLRICLADSGNTHEGLQKATK